EEYQWTGNIRELKSVLTRLYISCENGIVRAENIGKILPGSLPGYGSGKRFGSLADQERELILAAYERHQGNISAVSRELNISRNKVYKKLKESWKEQFSRQ
ncbi:MAG: helix-turn-helix domain-containing protein, partial [Pseudomonadota bacterium]